MKKLFVFLNSFLFWLLLTACAPESKEPMRVGTNLWPGYEPLYLAAELGYWDSSEVKMTEFNSSSEVMRAFRNKSIDAATLTLDEVIVLWQDNMQAEVVLVLDVSKGADVIIAKPDFTQFKDLKHHKIAVESTALGAYFISRALEINNMTSQDIEIIHLGVSDHENAFNNNQVQAVVTFEPVRTKLLEKGGVEVFSSRNIPGEIIDVLVIRKSYLRKNRHQAESLAEGWFEAIEYILNEPTDAAQRIAKRLNISPQEVLASYEGLELVGEEKNKVMLFGKQAQVNQTLMKLTASMMQNQLLTEPPPIERIINNQLIR